MFTKNGGGLNRFQSLSYFFEENPSCVAQSLCYKDTSGYKESTEFEPTSFFNDVAKTSRMTKFWNLLIPKKDIFTLLTSDFKLNSLSNVTLLPFIVFQVLLRWMFVLTDDCWMIIIQGSHNCGCSGYSCTHTFFRRAVLHPHNSIKNL